MFKILIAATFAFVLSAVAAFAVDSYPVREGGFYTFHMQKVIGTDQSYPEKDKGALGYGDWMNCLSHPDAVVCHVGIRNCEAMARYATVTCDMVTPAGETKKVMASFVCPFSYQGEGANYEPCLNRAASELETIRIVAMVDKKRAEQMFSASDSRFKWLARIGGGEDSEQLEALKASYKAMEDQYYN